MSSQHQEDSNSNHLLQCSVTFVFITKMSIDSHMTCWILPHSVGGICVSILFKAECRISTSCVCCPGIPCNSYYIPYQMISINSHGVDLWMTTNCPTDVDLRGATLQSKDIHRTSKWSESRHWYSRLSVLFTNGHSSQFGVQSIQDVRLPTTSKYISCS